jgi:hypothetical protein
MSSPLKFKVWFDAAARALGGRLQRSIWLPRRLVELRCAHRLDRMGARLQRMRARIDAMSAHLDGGAPDRPAWEDRSDGAPVGATRRLPAEREGNLRRMLAGLREEIATMRRELARWHLQECGGRTGARLGQALQRVNGIAVATSSAALALEARLAAHAAAD